MYEKYIICVSKLCIIREVKSRSTYRAIFGCQYDPHLLVHPPVHPSKLCLSGNSDGLRQHPLCFFFITPWIGDGKLLRIRMFGPNLRRFTSLYTNLTPFMILIYMVRKKSRDLNEKGNDFIFYNKLHIPSACFIVLASGVCTQPGPVSTLTLNLHAHTLLLPTIAWAEGCWGANSIIFF